VSLDSSYDNNCKYWKSAYWEKDSDPQYIISCSINGVLLPLTHETEALQNGKQFMPPLIIQERREYEKNLTIKN